MEKHGQTDADVILTDFSKAFDRNNTERLMQKLRTMRIPEIFTVWASLISD